MVHSNKNLVKKVKQKKSSKEKYSEREINVLISSINDHLVTYDKKWRYTFVNEAAAKILGKPREELLGKCIWDIFPDAVGNQYYKELHEAARTKLPINSEHYYPPFDKWFENHIYPFEDGVTVFATDITTRKRAEASLYESEKRFQNLADITPILIGMGDEHGNAIYLNKPYLDFLGRSLDEVKNYGYVDVIHPNDLPMLMDTYKKALATHTHFETEGRYRRHDGEYRWLWVSSAPRFRADGTFMGFVGTHVDITDRKKTEESIKQSEKKYRKLFDSMDQGFCIIEMIYDKNGKPYNYRFLEVNKAFVNQTGIENAVGKTMNDFVPKLEDFWYETYARVAETGDAVRFENHAENLHRFYEVYAFKMGEPEQREVAVLFTDITQRKLTEESIKESEARFRAIADDAPVFLFLAGENAEVEYLNKTWRDYTGISLKDSGGRAWAEITHPEDVEPATKIYMDGFYSRKSVAFENRQKGTDGIYRTILWKATPRFSPSGRFIGMMGVGLDIHERKRLEQQKDEFISIASHELKTPVTSIKAYTQVLYRRLLKEGNFKIAEHLGKMDNQLDKLTSLISDLLDSTKIDAGKLQFIEKYFDFNELVHEIIDEIQRTTERHSIEAKLTKTKMIYGDRDRIGQVVTNLLTNAMKYSPQAKKVLVKTKTDKTNLTLSVQDFGIGITKEKVEKVFERFYRAEERENQETYAGLGLGLYISSEIIKRHNGKIWVKSTVGKGSTFFFSLSLKSKAKEIKQSN